MKRTALLLACLLACPSLAPAARGAEPDWQGGRLLARTAQVLRTRLPSLEAQIDELEQRHRAAAERCASEAEERRIVFRVLEALPTSHLCLVSGFGYRTASADLMGRPHVTLGLWLVELDGRHFADRVLHDGPAWRAGIRRGDEVTAIDGVAAHESPRLDFRVDDAYLPDPPTRFVRCEKNVAVTLSVRTREDQAEPVEIPVVPAWTCTVDADRAAVAVLSRQGVEVGYVPIGLMTYGRAGEHLRDALEGPLAACASVVVDIRGRGGSPVEVWACLAHLKRARARGVDLVLLTDGRTRSAKEILTQRVRADALALHVGERTAGAVRRSRFLRVGPDTWMLCPAFGLETTFSAELDGVEPQVGCADALAWAHGRDPILEAGLREAIRRRLAAR